MEWDQRYRMLQEGEIIRASDQVDTDGPRGWAKPHPRTVGTAAPSPLYTSHRRYRRLKQDDAARTQDPRGCDNGRRIEPVFYDDQ